MKHPSILAANPRDRLNRLCGGIVSILAVAVLASCTRYSPLGLLGPTDKPDFAGMVWKKMVIIYYVRATPERHKMRRFKIDDLEVLDELRQSLKCKKISGDSTGCQDQVRITMADGAVWQGSFTFEDRFGLGLQSDLWRSYCLDLANTEFFYKMLDICLAYEKTITPTATREHIMLRGNLADSCFEVLDSPKPTDESQPKKPAPQPPDAN